MTPVVLDLTGDLLSLYQPGDVAGHDLNGQPLVVAWAEYDGYRTRVTFRQATSSSS